ncbi:MAG: two-component system response regulator NarL [Gammaproteobacteria bacterium]|nr:two-component system response regulator NarL [Gammaproteobacteria bacterium]MDE0714157.1 two-component system response regulator NarL [Gammaproteobacteria bacterium]MXX17098.1 two-component system response regulator NarL [Gammaproteobacteria bacterium]MXY64978.1 two-component system response regulator NarL [Gammaproteobacteria bacterium]MYG65127.1 two-component system response regulator NarL [Gammaproteobacteria bacterium]
MRVLIIDDHPLFRKGARQLLEMDARFEVVGEADDGASSIAQTRQLDPDLVLLDLNMKPVSGIEVLRRIKQERGDIMVVMLTVSDQGEDIAKAIQLGADGYLLKDMEPEDMLAKLTQVSQGQIVMDDNVANLLANLLKSGEHPLLPEDANLTERETETLVLLAEGLNNKRIARRLNISDGTVKVHIKNILRKLKVRSRLEAAIWAINNGFAEGR